MIERDKNGAMAAYETTQCLTSGIRRVLLREDEPKLGQSVSWEASRDGYGDRPVLHTGRVGGTVHLSYAEACAWAKAFRDKRVEKLREQIMKLEKLTFGDE